MCFYLISHAFYCRIIQLGSSSPLHVQHFFCHLVCGLSVGVDVDEDAALIGNKLFEFVVPHVDVFHHDPAVDHWVDGDAIYAIQGDVAVAVEVKSNARSPPRCLGTYALLE